MAEFDQNPEGSARPGGGGVKRPRHAAGVPLARGGGVGRGPAVPPGELVKLVSAEDLRRLKKATSVHKYTHGHALILSGPAGKGGAARLAARGALRIGAGLVTVGVPHDALTENAARLDAIMLAEIGDADALARVLKDTRMNALCLGPGLGQARARELVPVALGATGGGRPARGGAQKAPAQKGGAGASRIAGDPGKRAVVLDADALTAYTDDPLALFAMLHDKCVLTPHAGEFARLFPDIAEKLNAPPTKGPAYSRVDATREAAARAGCTILYKGPDTVIADPSGRCAVNSAHYERSAPWLATAGSGDVLAGFIAGLMARGFAPMQAAETAAWLHVECALSFGPGLIAEDLPEELPKVFGKLGL
jgi:NAD(P)H-hydrate repair Nnr-like enzyme with NAD(P)H-hydrate dehydratase domain